MLDKKFSRWYILYMIDSLKVKIGEVSNLTPFYINYQIITLITPNYRSEHLEFYFIRFSMQKYIRVHESILLRLQTWLWKNITFLRWWTIRWDSENLEICLVHGGFWKVQTSSNHYSATYNPRHHFFRAPLFFEKTANYHPPLYKVVFKRS